jgi:anhydro-N-acetylmuramic acid kinase
MLVIGLMSGTSADAVDAALVEWPDSAAARPFDLVSFFELPFAPELQQRIHRLAAGELPGSEVLRELLALDVLLAERFAEAADGAASAGGVALSRVRAIASHGQTVAHHPELRGTLQIGCPSRLAELSGCSVVADFRPRDLALGGEGAPLAPFFHHAVFADERECRGVLNLGGMANLTWLPPGADPDAVVAFDVGPANALIDGVVQTCSAGRERMDVGGARAARGRVDAVLLARLLDDDFLSRRPPKSTGRERYGAAQARDLVAESRNGGRSEDDLVATLVAFSAEAVARACRELLPGAAPGCAPLDRLLVGGGGAANPALLAALARALPEVVVDTMASEGVPIQAAEAMAFSLMGRNTLLGLPNHLPRCSGALRAGVLGELVPGRSGRI